VKSEYALPNQSVIVTPNKREQETELMQRISDSLLTGKPDTYALRRDF